MKRAGSVRHFQLLHPALESGPEAVLRPRLLKPLEGAWRHSSLVLVWGFPGLGKTWLVRQLCGRLGESVICLWRTAGPEDADGRWLAARLRDALGELVPLLRRRVAPPADSDLETHALDLADACTEALRRDVVVVLDDFHLAHDPGAGASSGQAFVSLLAEQAPPQLHIIAVARNLQSLPLEPLASRGRLFECGPTSLRWTAAEIGELIERLGGRPADPQEAEAVCRWSGGLVEPVAAALRAGPGVLEAAVADFRVTTPPSAPTPAFYPATASLQAILARLPAGTASFIERCALAPQLTPEVAASLSGLSEAKARALLHDLARGGGLLEVLPGEDRFRFHEMWRQAVRALLLVRGGRAAWQDACLRTAAAMKAAGHPEAAVDLLLDGGQWEQAADAIAALVLPLLEQNRHRRLWRWIEALPHEALQRHPGLFSLARGVALRHEGRLQEAHAALEQAEQAGAPPVRCLLAQADVAAARGEYDRTAELAMQAFRLLPAPASSQPRGEPEGVASTAPPASHGPRTSYEAARILELAAMRLWYRGERSQAAELLGRALEGYRLAGAKPKQAFCMVLLALTEHEPAGRFRHILEVIRAAREVAGEDDGGVLAYYEGSTWHCLGEYERAEPFYAEALRACRETGNLSLESLTVAKMGLLAAERHRLAEARDRLLEARRLLEGLGEPMRLANVHWGLSLVYRMEGEPSQAAAHAREDLRLMETLGFEVYVAESRLNLAWCALAAQDLPSAASLLDQAREALERWGSSHNLTLWNLARAAFLQASLPAGPERDQAVDACLQAALRLSEAGGYRFAWRREAAVCRLLLEGYLRRHPGDTYARAAWAEAAAQPLGPLEEAPWRLLFGLDGEGPAPAPEREGLAPARVVVRLLGAFELRVGDRPVPWGNWRSKPVRLLQFLLLRWDRWIPTEELVERFWPAVDPVAGKRALAVTVHYLRRQLAPWGLRDLVQSRKGSYRASDAGLAGLEVQVDLDEVAKLLRGLRHQFDEGKVEQLLGLYRGDLLQESPYEEWLEPERAALREDVVRMAEAAAQRALEDGDFARARQLAGRALELDPLRETLHRVLITALYAEGRRSEAVRQFRACRRLLRRQLGVAPERETMELVQRILDGKAVGPRLAS